MNPSLRSKLQTLDRCLGLAELAALVSMSPYHLARLFKDSTGVPPHRFIARQRIARPHIPGDAGPVHRADLANSGISGPRVTSPRCSAASRASRREDTERGMCKQTGPAGKGGEMDFTAIVAERTYEALGMVEQRPPFPRKTIDRDAALVDQLRRGDAWAAEALVGTYGDRVYRLALRITGNASDAEEVVQDALWTVSRKIDTFRGTAAFGSWVHRITANAAYDKLRGRRSKRHQVSWEDLVPPVDDNGQHAEVAVDWSRKLTDPAIEGELKGLLCRAIYELPADLRTIFLLHDVEGLSSPEIARTLHVKLAAITSRVHRARLFLRRRLADYVGAGLDVSNSCGKQSLMALTREGLHRNADDR
jgi:RNA polymerase sigma-70 factor (ECF subfamily)